MAKTALDKDDYRIYWLASDCTTCIAGITDGGLLETLLGFEVDVDFSTGKAIVVDINVPLAGDDYVYGLDIDLQQTAGYAGTWSTSGGMMGVRSDLHVDYKITEAYAGYFNVYIDPAATCTLNDMLGVFGRITIVGPVTAGAVTSQIAALRGSISNSCTGTYDGQVFSLSLDYGSDINYDGTTALIYMWTHGNAYCDYGISLDNYSPYMVAGIKLTETAGATPAMVHGIYIDANCTTAAIEISSVLGGKVAMTTTAETAVDPGRHLYLQRTYTGIISSAGLTGVEVRSTFNGSAASASMEVKGGEFKARHTNANTMDVGTMKGVIGNVDTKTGAKTITVGWALEGQIDCGTGSTITTGAGCRVAYNEDGTVTNAYGIFVDGTSVWDVGVKITDAKSLVGMDVGTCTTGINIAAASTACINLETGQATGINVAGTCSAAGLTMGALSTGGQALLVTWSGTADEATAVAAGICSVTATGVADPGTQGDMLIGYYANVVADTDDQPNAILIGFKAITEIKKNVDQGFGGHFQLKPNDATGVWDNGGAAVCAVLDVNAAVTISAGPLSGVWSRYIGAAAVTTGTTSCFFGDIDQAIDVGLDFDVADGITCTTGINLGVTSTGVYTTGISIAGTVSDDAIVIGGTYDHGLRFSAVPVAGDNTNSFINIGDYGTALAIGPTSAHQFGVMQNVSMTDIDVAYSYQANYTKITTAGTTTATSIAGHAFRMQVASDLAAVYGVQSHINITDDVAITQEAVAVSAYLSIDTGHTATSYRTSAFQAMIANPGGTGTFTGEAFVAYVVVAENATVDDAIKVYTQSTTTTTNMINIENDGIATNGILINNDGTMATGILFEGTLTTGIEMTNTTTTAINITGASLGVQIATTAGAANKAIRTVAAIAAGNLGDGVGAHELNMDLSGTGAGHTACLSSYVNVLGGTQKMFVAAQTNGIWFSAGDLTAANVIFGMRMISQISSETTERLCPFSVEASGDTIDALFHCSVPAGNLGFVADATETGSIKTGAIPFYIENSGTVGYVRIYSTSA